jgi:hypothetical protein
LISIKEVNVGLNYGAEVIQRVTGSNGGNLKFALVLLYVKLYDTALLIEEAEVLLIFTAHILNNTVIEWNINAFEDYFFDSVFDALFISALHSDFSFVALVAANYCPLDLDQHAKFILDALYLATLRAHDQTD